MKQNKQKQPEENQANENIGDVLLELEVVLDKMCDHGLQLGDILALVNSHIQVHRPDAIEMYDEDGSSPVLKYGHKDYVA